MDPPSGSIPVEASQGGAATAITVLEKRLFQDGRERHELTIP
jgi:hypothetical protein